MNTNLYNNFIDNCKNSMVRLSWENDEALQGVDLEEIKSLIKKSNKTKQTKQTKQTKKKDQN